MADDTPIKNPYDIQDGEFKPEKSAQPEEAPQETVQPKQLISPQEQAGEKGSNPFEEEHDGGGIIKKAVIGIVIIAIIGILVYHFVFSIPSRSASTTITVAPSFNINSCTTVSKPGVYQITGDISTAVVNGSCIKVTSSDVSIQGLGHAITGSGPFVTRRPYSYAVFVESAANVTVSELNISKFTYGVYYNNSNHGAISGIRVNNATLSGIYLNNSEYIALSSDYVHGAGAQAGGVVITHGRNNTLNFVTSKYNSYTDLAISNSTGNRVSNSTLVGSPTDIACFANSSFRFSNNFENTSCYVNNGCNFAYCVETNVQSNISSINLPYSIDGCGSINHPGAYSLSRDLAMNDYLNLTLQEGKTAPCITMNASNVYLNCNGHSISNAHDGISTIGQYNVTVDNCNFDNNTYGLYLRNLITFKLHDVGANGNDYGVYVNGSTGGNLTGISSDRNTYGYYINGTTYVTVTGFTAANNTYGIYLDNSSDVFFKGGTAVSDSKIDLYCSTDTYNSSLMGLSQSACRSTDCNWAPSCPIKYLPSLAAFPVTACTTITIPGVYQLNNNVFSDMGTCFKIKASSVVLNCAGHLITGSGSSGYAFDVENETGVAIEGCKINGFTDGVHAYNAGHISVQYSTISNVHDGLNINDSNNSDIMYNNVTSFSGDAISLNSVYRSIVDNNHASGSSGTGIALYRSFNNSVENNIANLSAYGYYLSNSRNNLVSNNIASGSTSYDYYCSPGTGAVNAQPVAQDRGNNKLNCKWLVEIPLQQQLQGCQAIEGAGYIALDQDMVTTGMYCFSAITSNSSISVSGTTIDCRGHSILSASGRYFAYFINNGGVTIKDCVLIGYKNPVVFTTSTGQLSGISIENDTIFNSGTAVTISNASNSAINNDTMINVLKGANLYKYNSGTVEGDSFDNATIGVYLNDSSSVSLLSNNFNDTQSGIVLVNATKLGVGKNILTNSKSYGFYCAGTSKFNTSGTSDEGGNMCPTGASGCSWLTSSPFCKNSQ